jgi:hypothetical protein
MSKLSRYYRENEGMMQGVLPFLKLTPMDIILEGLRPNDDWYEKKKLDERDDIWKGKIIIIPERRKKDGTNSTR